MLLDPADAVLQLADEDAVPHYRSMVLRQGLAYVAEFGFGCEPGHRLAHFAYLRHDGAEHLVMPGDGISHSGDGISHRQKELVMPGDGLHDLP